jgi:hypothetical protein
MEDNKINLILEKLISIESRLKNLESKFEDVKEDTEKMSGHINFVEGVYGNIKKPFHFIMSNVGGLIPHMITNVESQKSAAQNLLTSHNIKCDKTNTITL